MICVTSVDIIRTPVVDVIGQLIRDHIGRLSVEPRCNWLGRLNSDRCVSIRRRIRGQYCESKSVCCLSVDVVNESFVGCGKLLVTRATGL